MPVGDVGRCEHATCRAWTIAHPQPRVLIFAADDLQPGDEMTWDYGREYWEGRHDKV